MSWIIKLSTNITQNYEKVRETAFIGSAQKGSESIKSQTSTKGLFVPFEKSIPGRTTKESTTDPTFVK